MNDWETAFNELPFVQQLKSAMAGVAAGCYGLPFKYPVANSDTPYYHFGSPAAYKNQKVPHPGVDFVGPKDSVVQVVADGVVAVNNYDDNGYGNYIVLKHQFAVPQTVYVWSLYGHLQSTGGLTVGDTLHAGDTVGIQGRTGNAGGIDHVHFELKRDAQLSRYSVLLAQGYVGLVRYFYEPYTVIDRMRYVPKWWEAQDG